MNYIALYWLLGGLLTTRWALGVRWRAGSRLGLAAGLLATAMGLVLMARHRLEDIVSPEALIGAVAVTTVATGCLRIVGAFEVEERTGHRWTIGGMILGSVEVVLGVSLFLVLFARIVDPALQSPRLLVRAHFQPVLQQDDP